MLKSREWVWWFIAVALFVGGHLFITWRVWGDPSTLLPGPTGDNCMMTWNLGWVHYALRHGSPGFWCTASFYPSGFMFIYGSHIWLDGVLYWLMSWVLPAGFRGAVLWANIMLLTATVGTGVLAISAMKAWRINNWPMLLLASAGVAFSWFRMYALMGHYNFFGTQWMLAALCLLSWARRAQEDEELRRAQWLTVAAGAALGLAALNDQTKAIFAAGLGGLILLSGPGMTWRQRLGSMIPCGALYYGVGLLIACIHLVPMAQAALAGRLDYYHVDKSLPRLVDASSLLFPNDFHYLGKYLKGLREQTGLAWAEGTYLGIVQIGLLVACSVAAVQYLFTRRAPYRVCFYAAGAAWGLISLALGDRLMIGREQYFLLPGRLLKEIPLLNNMRVPQRWIWPAQLAIALGGASALAVWLRDLRGLRRLLWWAPALLAFVPVLEGRSYPMPDPVDFKSDFMQPAGLMPSIRDSFTSGSVLTMPVEITYAQANVVQFLTGYDIPMAITYTARMPLDVNQLPWKWGTWTPEAGQWLRDHDVTMVVFPFHPGRVEEFAGWVKEAKAAVPGLVAINKYGERL
jgi:hypothetical protein